MVINHLIAHGLIYGTIVTASLLLIMLTVNPRVWGYSDYPQAIKEKVPPQTRQERSLAFALSVPWLLFTFGFPIYSTLVLKSKLEGEIAFWLAFLNLLILFLVATIGDLLILDWLIVSKITPRFVIIPGTEAEDYKDFSHH